MSHASLDELIIAIEGFSEFHGLAPVPPAVSAVFLQDMMHKFPDQINKK